MKVIIVLALHGVPPGDFPRKEMAEFFALHGRMAQSTPAERAAIQRRHDELESRMRNWPRTAQNDPFHAGSLEMARRLAAASGHEVVVGFNEFCAPSLDEALDQAAAGRPDKVVVVTPMMVPGGEHSEIEIPARVEAARRRHPGIAVAYAWPLDADGVAAFLAEQAARFM